MLLLLLLINRMVLLLLLLRMQMLLLLLMLWLEMLLWRLLRLWRLIIQAIWERIYSVGAESIYIGFERELIEERLHRVDLRVVNRLVSWCSCCIVCR